MRLRTLEAQGIVEIKVGSGGGARIARGNARLFAEALAVQLDLAGVSVGEIMDAQRAIECLAAELAAANSTAEDHARLRALIADAERRIDDVGAFTRVSREFHLAVAEASHNRVLVVQLISLQHVSWPAHNPTLTPQRGAPRPRRAQGIGVTDRNARRRRRAAADGRARQDDRRAARGRAPRQARRRSRLLLSFNETQRREKEATMIKQKFIIEPHFRLQEWVAEEKGYFKDEGLDYVFQELIQSSDGAHHYKGDKVGAMQSFERGRRVRRELRLPLDRRRRRLEGKGPALCRRLLRRAGGRVRAGGLAGAARPRTSPACRSRSAISRAATTRRSRRSSSTCRPTRST